MLESVLLRYFVTDLFVITLSHFLSIVTTLGAGDLFTDPTINTLFIFTMSFEHVRSKSTIRSNQNHYRQMGLQLDSWTTWVCSRSSDDENISKSWFVTVRKSRVYSVDMIRSTTYVVVLRSKQYHIIFFPDVMDMLSFFLFWLIRHIYTCTICCSFHLISCHFSFATNSNRFKFEIYI